MVEKRIEVEIAFYGDLANMPKVSEVFIIDVSKIISHRATKHCICVSAGENKCFLINSEHLDKSTVKIIAGELETWLEQENYAENKLKTKFGKKIKSE